MDFTARLMDKILNHLTLREGYRVLITQKKTQANINTAIDSMGFIYEISVNCVGRLQTSAEDDPEWQVKQQRFNRRGE
jgi:hypothetical protein